MKKLVLEVIGCAAVSIFFVALFAYGVINSTMVA